MLKKITAQNLTTVDLRVLILPSTRSGLLKPLETLAYESMPWPTGGVQVFDSSGSRLLALLSPTPDQLLLESAQVRITPDRLTNPAVETVQDIVFVNNTDEYVTVELAGYPPMSTLSPGEAAPPFNNWWRGACFVKSLFTGEMIDVFVVPTAPSGNRVEFSITGRLRSFNETNRHLLLPPVLPSRRWYKDDNAPELTLVGYPTNVEPPEPEDYITIGQSLGKTRVTFNALPNATTRRIKISGPELRWDSSNPKLKDWGAGDMTDLESVEIYADRVIISQKLHFPNTNVTIWARELRFEGEGAIDTTPRGWSWRASPDDKLDPGASERVKNKEDPRNGRPGEKAGDVVLNVCELSFPNDGKKRLIARGGQGQEADYGSQPQAAPLRAITFKEVERLIGKFPSSDKCWQWDWPGGAGTNNPHSVDWPGQVTWYGPNLLEDEGATRSHVDVVNLKLVAVSYAPFAEDVNIFWFPDKSIDDVWKKGKNFGWGKIPTRAEVLNESRSPPQRTPGKDAIPGGTPGQGGSGGTITTTVNFSGLDTVCNVTGGDPGKDTPAVEGGKAGGPSPAYIATMVIILKAGASNRDVYLQDHQMWPWLDLQALPEGPSGKPAPAIAGQPGARGKLEAADGTGAPSQWTDKQGRIHLATAGRDVSKWMHPTAVDAVLVYAKDCFRLNHRALAARQLEPYYSGMTLAAARSQTLSGDLQSRLFRIQMMRHNLIANLDYYGNPPGWVPHLTASTAFTLNVRTRKVALELLLFARDQIAAFEGKAEKAVDLEDIRKKLGGEVTHRQERLASAYKEILNARTALSRLEEQAKALDEHMGDVQTELKKEITDQAETQRIVSGIGKIVGGVLKGLPFGQPVVGLAADVVSAVADVDFYSPNPGAEFNKTLGKLKTPLDTFITDKDGGQRLFNPSKKDQRALEDDIVKAKRSAEDSKREVETAENEFNAAYTAQTAALAAAKDKVGQSAALTTLNAKLKEVKDDIDTLNTPKRDEIVKKLASSLGHTETAAQKIHVDSEFLREYLKDIQARIDRLQQEDVKALAEKSAQVKSSRENSLNLLASERKKVDDYATALRTLERTRDDKATEVARKTEDIGEWAKSLAGVGAGLGTIGEGVGKLWVPAGADDAAVKAKIEQIVEKPSVTDSGLAKAYRNLLKQSEEMHKNCSAALLTLQQQQQAAATEIASITAGLTSLSEMSRVSAQLNGALDIRVRNHLAEMEARALEMMQESIYHFIMAFRYEYCEDVPPELYRIDNLVKAFAEFSIVDTQGNPRKTPDGKPMTLFTMPEKEYIDLDTKLMKEQLAIVARDIIAGLMHGKTRSSFDIKAVLPQNARAILSKEGEVEISLAQQLGIYRNFDVFGLRIVQISMKKGDLEFSIGGAAPKTFNIRLEFSCPRASIIYQKTTTAQNGAYYFFTKGDRDYPLKWAFTCMRQSGVAKDHLTSDKEEDETLLGALIGDVALHDYRPGVYGPPMTLTASVVGGAQFDFDITKLEFTLTLEKTV